MFFVHQEKKILLFHVGKGLTDIEDPYTGKGKVRLPDDMSATS